MLERIRKLNIISILLSLGGMAILFFGATQVFDLFEKVTPPDYAGEEVPRDMIEAGFLTGDSDFTLADGDMDFSPLIVPQASVEAPDLLTLDPATGDTLDRFETLKQTPSIPEDLLATLRASYLDEQGEEDENSQTEDILAVPEYIYIPAIALEAPVVKARSATVFFEEGDDINKFSQWQVPNRFAAGWHTDSALLGEVGNTVMNGHHNVHDRVFRNLAYLQEGDVIQVYGGGEWYNYVVANKMVLPEWGVTLERRMENAAWIMPSDDERLTLVTCWPEQSISHRLIIVAIPISW